MHISKWLLWCGLLLAASCTYPEKIKDGKTSYDRKQYAVAIPMLRKEYDKTSDHKLKAERAYMLAESYRHTNQPQPAAEWYGKALDQRHGKDEGLQQARMYQQLQDYDQAVKAFQSAGRTWGDVNYYREQIIASKNAKQWLAKSDSSDYKVETLKLNSGQAFNTPYTDFSPVRWGDGLLFSSDRATSVGKDKYKWTNQKFFDLYIFDQKADTVGRWAMPFNGQYHQGVPCFSPDGNTVYFTQCGSNAKSGTDYCQIMVSRKTGSGWSEPQRVPLGDPECNYLHPHLAREGKWLFFASNGRAGGLGGYDIYMSVWMEVDGKWGVPKNLGSAVNTKGNEVFPFLHQDTMYLASDGHPGMGGLDVFRVERIYDQWKNLQNLRAPINSGGDDFGLIVTRYDSVPSADSIQLAGYLTSNRIGGVGSDDIYRFSKRFPPVPLVPDTPKVDTTPKVVGFQILLEARTLSKQYETANNPNSRVIGNEPLPNTALQIASEDTVYTVYTSPDSGTLRVSLHAGKSYQLRASKDGYFSKETEVSTQTIALDSLRADTVLYAELVLDKIFVNQEIVLENIYYDYDRAEIRADAEPTLKDLAALLQKNPQIRIQLASHTDCRGKDAYNLDLSQRRAQSAVQYLVRQGINENRLVAKGFGETKPSATCKCELCTEDEHQRNRRTTFMVLE